MPWVITTDMSPRLLGGMGHTYFDILSAFIISRLYNMTYAHKQLKIAQVIANWTREMPEWDDFLNIYKDEVIYREEDYVNYEKVNLNMLKRFMSFTKDQLNKIFQKYCRYDNILFVLSQNNRFHLNELYELCRKSVLDATLFDSIRETLRQRCVYQAQLQLRSINVHIRRGDVKMEPLSYYKNILDKVQEILAQSQNGAYDAQIITFGDQSQVTEIKECFGPGIKYRINKPAIEDFKELMNSEILICPWSSYSKLAGYYSNARVVIFMPFYPTFFNPNKCKDGYLGYEIETYGKNWIPAKINGEFDTAKFREIMQL